MNCLCRGIYEGKGTGRGPCAGQATVRNAVRNSDLTPQGIDEEEEEESVTRWVMVELSASSLNRI